jgi:hypothetical protein
VSDGIDLSCGRWQLEHRMSGTPAVLEARFDAPKQSAAYTADGLPTILSHRSPPAFGDSKASRIGPSEQRQG